MDEYQTNKQAVINKVERVVGYVPMGLGDILSILMHPDVWPFTSKLVHTSEPGVIEGEN